MYNKCRNASRLGETCEFGELEGTPGTSEDFVEDIRENLRTLWWEALDISEKSRKCVEDTEGDPGTFGNLRDAAYTSGNPGDAGESCGAFGECG